jgi:hypothetical protein
VPSDLLPILRKNPNLMTAINDPVGLVGVLKMNHLFPPFNDVRARRAILMALSREDYMRVVVGDDGSLWKPMPGYFPPGTPLYTDDGGDILPASTLLRGSPPLAGASVLSASRLEPLVLFPLASPARFSRSVRQPDRASRCLHARCCSVGIRTSTELIPEDGSLPGFDTI